MGDAKLTPGRVLGERYVLEARLGSGSSGAVWSARDRRTGDPVALKLLHAHLREDASLVRQMAREHDVLRQLDHPNLARCRALGADGPQVFLAMELVRGETLHVELARRARAGARFAPDEIERWLGELASAVGHAHARGIVHRDLKPQNIMLEPARGGTRVRVLDFGIARVLESNLFEATTFGRQLGSLFYMSPEQVEGAPAGPASDVFALATLLFEILTLRRCWARAEDGGHPLAFVDGVPGGRANAIPAVFERIRSGPRPSATALDPELPAGLDAFFARALAVEPERRFASAAELSAAFLDLASELPGDDPLETAAPTAPGPRAELDGSGLEEAPAATVAAPSPARAPSAPAAATTPSPSAPPVAATVAATVAAPSPARAPSAPAATVAAPSRARAPSAPAAATVALEPLWAEGEAPAFGDLEAVGPTVATAGSSLDTAPGSSPPRRRRRLLYGAAGVSALGLGLFLLPWGPSPGREPAFELQARLADLRTRPGDPQNVEALREALAPLDAACAETEPRIALIACAELALDRLARSTRDLDPGSAR